jgi:ribosome-associated toxin RatA of RatAB toxin-antitoxin module
VDKEIKFINVLNVSQKKAFEVVSNFEKYKEFIPGCKNSLLIERKHPVEIGCLEFNILGKEYYIESKNVLSEDSIEINQIKGPFEKFKGTWRVKKEKSNSCEIEFHASFRLPFLLNALTPQPLVDKFSNVVIDSFIKRVI